MRQLLPQKHSTNRRITTRRMSNCYTEKNSWEKQLNEIAEERQMF